MTDSREETLDLRETMKINLSIGTKSVLFGVHQFALHPLLVGLGWWKAFGLRSVRIGPDTYTTLLDPRLWLAFAVHDLGYVGKPNMDGAEGETHPGFGAAIMRRLFGDVWGDLVLLHSRYYAKKLGREISPLCIADKWVIVLEPSWLYLPRVWASGELREFIDVGYQRAAAASDNFTDDERADMRSRNALRWHRAVKSYMVRWIAAHANGAPDTWTRNRHGAAV